MPRITALYAWVIEDSGPDDEGVPAFLGPGGNWMPMIGADKERAESLRPAAEQIASLHGKRVRLLCSVGELEEVEVIEPG